jgi:hypothetical protein
MIVALVQFAILAIQRIFTTISDAINHAQVVHINSMQQTVLLVIVSAKLVKMILVIVQRVKQVEHINHIY